MVNNNFNRGQSSRRYTRWLPALLAFLALPAWAQQYYDPGILQTPITSMPSGFAAEGIRLGSFVLTPALDLAVEDHDNIYYENQDEVSDVIYHIRPKVGLSSGWSRHALSMAVIGDFARFQDNSSEDYDDLMLTLDGRIDVKRGSYFTAATGVLLLHEDRSSPEDPGGSEPTDFSYRNYKLGYHHNFNRLTAALSFGRNEWDYDNNIDEDGEIIDNTDRDRTNDSLGLRMDYLVAPQRKVFLALNSNTVKYDLPADEAGFARDSDGYQVRGGLAMDISGVLTGDIYAQYLSQDYDDPRFPNESGASFGLGLDWSPSRLTGVSFRIEQSVLETTQEFSSGYLSTLYAARLQHELRRWLLFHARISYTDNEYGLAADAPADALADTQIVRAGLGLSYLVNRHAKLTFGYTFEDQDANLETSHYQANRIYLVLGLEL